MERTEESSTLPEPTEGGGNRQVGVLLLGDSGSRLHGRGRVVRIPTSGEGLRIGRGSGGGSNAEGEGGPGGLRPSGEVRQINLEDALLSRAHLRIVRRAKGFEVLDEGSRNGTFLDGRRLARATRLDEGSILCFGRQAGVFRITSEDALTAVEEEARAPFGPVATMSPVLAQRLALLRRLARTAADVLLLGETGVGKEVYARGLHEASGRAGRFVALSCAAIPDELAESELFGYVRGAHSAAREGKPGLLVAADGGTLFFDGLGDASPRLQAMLLRFLDDREVRPVGATAAQRVDLKVVAATHALEIEDGPGRRLRQDLVARFGAEAVTILPLRHRMEDVAPLIGHFTGGRGAVFHPEAHRAVYSYGWPGNVRELEKVMGRAIVLADNGRIGLEHVPASLREANRTGPPVEAATRRQRGAPSPEVLRTLLAEHDGNVAAVARALDRQWTVVWRWVTKHGLLPTRPGRPVSR
jgi:DNA-binding NtrC family response regulator